MGDALLRAMKESVEGFSVAFALLSWQKGKHPKPPNLCSRELPAHQWLVSLQTTSQ